MKRKSAALSLGIENKHANFINAMDRKNNGVSIGRANGKNSLKIVVCLIAFDVFASFACFFVPNALAQDSAALSPAEHFTPGEEIKINNMTFYVKDTTNTTLTLSVPLQPTAIIGDMITPVSASGTPGQAGTGRSPAATINSSGLMEIFPGSAFFVHANDINVAGASMWNTSNVATAQLEYDLGKVYNVSGLYVWNYNEPGYESRGIKNASVEVSEDKQSWKKVGDFVFAKATGSKELPAQIVKFESPVHGRYFRINALLRYGSDAYGLSEIRFANADKAFAVPSRIWKPKYERPRHPALSLGQPLAGEENYVFPEGANIVDVTKPPYSAKGDGIADDTDAIQRALDAFPAQGAIIYLPNGKYLVSKQLRWGGGDDMTASKAAKQIVMWGQSTRGTVIQLKDRCPGFNDPRYPRGVLWTGAKPAQRFGNEIHNLTVDTGENNPGACGIQFIANNQGGVYDVNIVSGDGQGFAGLDLGYTDEQGPMLAKNVDITGFDYGIFSAHGVASWTGEGIRLRGQNRAGIVNNGQPASLRKIEFTGTVPAVENGSGLLVLIDSKITGTDQASELSAISINGGSALIRNLKTSGFKNAIEDRVNNTVIESGAIVEHRTNAPKTLLSGAPSTLNLPIKETPEIEWPAPDKWMVVKKLDSDGIQAAIDSGAEFVYLPRGSYKIDKTIVVGENVRRIFGGKAYFTMHPPLKDQAAPIWRVEDGKSPVILIEGITCDFSTGPFSYVDHASKRTLVLKRSALHGGENVSYTNSVEGGEVFLDDVVTGRNVFKNQQVWARQFNPEPTGNRLAVDGGTFWVLGYKTERIGEIAVAKNGARVEILGGLSQTSGSKDKPMFVNENSQMSVTFSEVNHSEDPFVKFVRETKNGQIMEWENPDKKFKGWRTILYEGR